ncbi:MAG: radical SAM protein [Planctomycetota bacterium]|jgi:molybdenum cofactor biosynthesis enzyme MoaA|nr:radical SAM protein [Planctomycetota bacterium]
MLRKAIKQFQLGVKNPTQAARVLASEAKMRAGIRTLRSLELAVTWICNLDCDFCYAEDLMKAQQKPPHMPVAEVARITREAHELGLIHVNVTGGEPMVRKDIYDVVDAIPKDVVVSLVTNSTLLTEEKVDLLKEAGLSTIQMSYGSYYLDTFKRDLARYCVDRGISVTLSVVNLESERKNIEHAFKMAEEDDFSVLFNYPMIYNNVGLDSEYYWKMRYHPRCREDNMFWSGKNRCPAGTHKLYVTNDGDVMTCDRIHAIYGNMHEEALAPIHKRMYEQFIKHKSFCLLETCDKQWDENNRRSGRSYSKDLVGTNVDPFNVFEGTTLMNGSIPGSTLAQQMHKSRIAGKDGKPEPASK